MLRMISVLVLSMVLGGWFFASAGCTTKSYSEKHTKGDVSKSDLPEDYDTPPEGS